MKEVLKKLQERLENMTEEEKAKEYESITHEKFYSRWVEKIHQIGRVRRDVLIKKCIQKYSSPEYIDKEYKLGYEPREELFWMLFEYAKVYGEEHTLEDDSFFPTESYVIDDEWCVEVMYGQGSSIYVDKYKKYEPKKHYAMLQGNYGIIGDLSNECIKFIEENGEKYPDILECRHHPVLIEMFNKFADDGSLNCEGHIENWGSTQGYYYLAEFVGDEYTIKDYDGRESLVTPEEIKWNNINNVQYAKV